MASLLPDFESIPALNKKRIAPCGQCETFTEVTDLHFRPLSEGEIARYVESGEPMDKAGSYGIQGGAALFCERMVGDYYNVMGLPVCRLGQVLRKILPEIMEE